MAQSHGPAALTGTVSSQQEGKMEGVVVSAKRPGSTIMVSVSTNAQGQYRFPQDRLAPGTYDITMRAVGYTLKPTSGNDPIGRARATRPSAREGRAGRSRPANVQQRVDAKRAGHARGRKWHCCGASIVMACSVRCFPRKMPRKWRCTVQRMTRILPMLRPIFRSSCRTRR